MNAKLIVYGPNTRRHKLYLFFHGFRHDDGNRYIYFGRKRKCEKLAKKCLKRGMQAKYIDEFTDRSGNYRKIYFDNNRPYIFNLYICAYCGKLLRQENVTVDHIYPVTAVQHNKALRKKLERKGYSSINDPRNLVSACSRCNEKKSGNIEGWVWKAKIGRNYFLWHIRKICRIIISLAIIYICYKIAVKYGIMNL